MPARNFIFILIAALVCYACYSVAVKNRYARLFSEAISIVETEALHDVPSDELFKSAMKGMLKDFDQHSEFISGSSFKSLNEDLEGEFGGVGIYFEPLKGEGVLVMATIPDKPADRAGLKAGDLITSIAGENTITLEPGEIRNLMTGVVGAKVKVGFLREGQTMDTVVERERISIESVHGMTRNADGSWNFSIPNQPGLAYIRLTQFDKASASEMAEALQGLPADTKGIILDVRSNGGGLLTAAEKICDMFLEPGLSIVTIKGRKGVVVSSAVARDPPLVDPSVKLVVLINRQSASASEIVAACLQDHGRAVVIGEQSWGKGTVQNVIAMQMGSSALKLTTFSYWPPSGRPIDRYNKDVKESKNWGVFPNEGMAVEQDKIDAVCLMKKNHVREISGLIPESKRREIIDRSINNFLNLVNREETADQVADVLPAVDAVPPSTETPPPVKIFEPDSDPDKTDEDASATGEEPTRKISREDLERDPVLEKAIEFLKSAAVPVKKAA